MVLRSHNVQNFCADILRCLHLLPLRITRTSLHSQSGLLFANINMVRFWNHFTQVVIQVISIVWQLSARCYVLLVVRDHAAAVISVPILSSFRGLDSHQPKFSLQRESVSYVRFAWLLFLLSAHVNTALSSSRLTSSLIIFPLYPSRTCQLQRCNVFTLVPILFQTNNVLPQTLPFFSRKLVPIERMCCVSPQRIGEAFVPLSNLAIAQI